MQAKHPAIEFLASLPHFELLMGHAGWFVLDLRTGMTASAPDLDEPKSRDGISLRFPGAPNPFIASLKPYLDLAVMETCRLLNLQAGEEDALQIRADTACRLAKEGA